jgi:hypothetical protein
MSEQENKIKSLEILVTAKRSALDYQLNADNGLDTKIGVLLGFIATIAVFYLGIIDKIFPIISLILLFLLGMSALFLIKAIGIKEYFTGVIDISDSSEKFKDYMNYDKYNLLDQLRLDYESAFNKNDENNKHKKALYNSASIYFWVGVLLIVIFYIFSLCLTINQ